MSSRREDRGRVARRVWIHRTGSFLWIALFVPAVLYWPDSVLFVIAASVYANVKSDWAASEAADDRVVLAAVADLRQEIAALREELRSTNRS